MKRLLTHFFLCVFVVFAFSAKANVIKPYGWTNHDFTILEALYPNDIGSVWKECPEVYPKEPAICLDKEIFLQLKDIRKKISEELGTKNDILFYKRVTERSKEAYKKYAKSKNLKIPLKPSDLIHYGFRIEIDDQEIYFLKNNKCKVDISLFVIFEKFDKTVNCSWKQVESGSKVYLSFVSFIQREYILQKDIFNNIIGMRSERAYKFFPYERSYPTKLAKKFNVSLELGSKIAKKEPSQTQKKKEIKIRAEGYAQSTYTNTTTWSEIKERICGYARRNAFANAQGELEIAFNANFEYTEKKLFENATQEKHKSIGKTKRVRCHYGAEYTFDFSAKSQIAQAKPKQKPENSSNDQENLDKERQKIEEERRKLEEEKRKIAEAKKKREEEEKKRKEANAKLYVIGSGTGFFVSSSGHAVSNEHVVGICRKVATKIDGEKVFFNILKTDQVNDLGLIKGDYKSPNFLSIKSDGAEFGEDIVAFGYPLRGILSSSVKLTRGIVSSLSGLNDNYSEIQIDAAIQPGNSGGPVLNMEGQVVGVASSGLNKLAMIEEAEYIPENVNFAVAAPTLHNFLKSNGVRIKNTPLKINNTKELAKIGRPATIQLFCLNTKAKHEELKNKKKHSDVLLEKVIELD